MATHELSDNETASISGTESSYDAVAAFNEKFSLKCEPDFRLKLKKKLKGVSLAAHLTVEDVSHRSHFSDSTKQSWHFTVRPAEKSANLVRKLLHKVAIFPDQSRLSWSSDKMLLFKFFKLQLAAEYDWRTQTPSASYQVTTKWSTTPNNTNYKRKLPITSRAAVVGHMHLNYSMPQLQGGFGGNQATTADVDEGSCHLEIPRVDLELSLDDRPGNGVQPLWSRIIRRQRKEEQPEAFVPEADLKPEHISNTVGQRPFPWCLDEPWKLPWLPQDYGGLP